MVAAWSHISSTAGFDRGTVHEFPVGESVLSEPTPAVPGIVIYTTAICPYCVAAKNFLKSKGQAWTEVRIDLDPVEREKMVARARRTSVPQIFIGDTHVGGYDDMIALHRQGGLDPLLSGA
ncbi:glutaredoxin 3 [Lysobacter niastensis]|uniref:Glutaredoxin n=1 Tax=Lysobacter niastensis TaxID=380629 RepID=A0ABU1WFM9_9GAMM|nr:glutaredoxin 3 [Lysobacter niastensis]